MDMPSLLSVTPIYIAILGVLFLPFTMYAGFYRGKVKINLGDGGNEELLKRVRAQGNFIETVPIALILLVALELQGASDNAMHALGVTLVVGRILHWLAMTEIGPFIARPIGMLATLLVIAVSSVWILVDIFA